MQDVIVLDEPSRTIKTTVSDTGFMFRSGGQSFLEDQNQVLALV